jgi:hypothetical protein
LLSEQDQSVRVLGGRWLALPQGFDEVKTGDHGSPAERLLDAAAAQARWLRHSCSCPVTNRTVTLSRRARLSSSEVSWALQKDVEKRKIHFLRSYDRPGLRERNRSPATAWPLLSISSSSSRLISGSPSTIATRMSVVRQRGEKRPNSSAREQLVSPPVKSNAEP